ncbi:MAG: barstar family protein [Pseudonocardia sp.]|uniref:barstar family protein n=1 Tax=unclassified Pseudonocardia TaxID=2619320 RepID=UPI00086B10D2|nr:MULTISPECIES: barstar family protein [unclassified Pseudonocardia]MBN9110547.1 barstar family protein [Pseudonocardia sp.]ODV00679.1 MAG: hypothetical protein ABT15_28855 [Pseudonocardia sp. SCN 73-27]
MTVQSIGLQCSPRDAGQVADTARQCGARVARVDGPRDRQAFYQAVAAQLDVPDWFGHNLDALRDVLTDLSWLPAGEIVLIWDDPAALAPADAEGHDRLLDVLADAAAASGAGERPLRVVLTGRI